MTNPAVVASIEGRGNGGIEGRTMTGDVKLAYNAAARDKCEQFRSAPIFSKAGRLANELRTYYRDGWGELDNDQDGRALFAVLLHTIANTGGDRLAKMREAQREFAPWLSENEFQRMAEEALRVRRWWTADKLAQRIGLTYEDRQRLRITMIGAVDMPKIERDRLTRERAAAAKKARRRANGVIPREEYEAGSISRTEPWKAEGISRATWYRRRCQASETSLTEQAGETSPTEAQRRKSNAPVRLVSSRRACTAASPSHEVKRAGISHSATARVDRQFKGRSLGRSSTGGRLEGGRAGETAAPKIALWPCYTPISG
jgi:hypothetical protein